MVFHCPSYIASILSIIHPLPSSPASPLATPFHFPHVSALGKVLVQILSLQIPLGFILNNLFLPPWTPTLLQSNSHSHLGFQHDVYSQRNLSSHLASTTSVVLESISIVLSSLFPVFWNFETNMRRNLSSLLKDKRSHGVETSHPTETLTDQSAQNGTQKAILHHPTPTKLILTKRVTSDIPIIPSNPWQCYIN